MSWSFRIALIILTFFSLPAKASNTLVTDISSHLISVTSDFTGTDLLLFGSIQSSSEYDLSEPGDIIVVVRGPHREVMVRKKERILGIWANTQSVSLSHVPGFYVIASNKPIEEITDPATLGRLRIGKDKLGIIEKTAGKDTADYEAAVVRQNSQNDLYSYDDAAVIFLGSSLFRTSVHFPANVPVGNYIAEIYLFLDGELISAQTSPLFIKKFGVGRRIFEFANRFPYIHGIVAILIALAAGWIASVLFRKD
ncbi:TIGR02186 family protein [Sneathiella limimaris]|uniref:TIGR02186 family protein n=1 Tax=Sneathiella limimaris TaxID=1964213 RepID=UPI00146BC091|nr:TIGR02186 family protein [Sneathiella limimaris]